MDVHYSDFVLLCRVRDPENLEPNYVLKIDGIYVKDIPANVDLEPSERAALTEHPTGDLTQPCLKFPCSMEELQNFLEYSGMYGCIDPFDMHDWTKAKDSTNSVSSKNQSSEPNENSELHRRKELTYQKVIAVQLALQHGKLVSKPYKLTDAFLEECQLRGIKAPAGRSTLGSMFAHLPPVQKADPESNWTET